MKNLINGINDIRTAIKIDYKEVKTIELEKALSGIS